MKVEEMRFEKVFIVVTPHTCVMMVPWHGVQGQLSPAANDPAFLNQILEDPDNPALQVDNQSIS